MARIRLVTGVKFWYQDGAWQIVRLLHGKKVLTRSLTFGHERTFQWSELIKFCLTDGSLRFEVSGKAARAEEGCDFPTQYEWSDFGTVPEPQRTQAWIRYQVIKPLLRLPPGTRTKQMVIERLQVVLENVESVLPPDYAGQPFSLPHNRYQTLYEWIKSWEDSGGDPRSLVPRYDLRRRGRTSIDSDLVKIIDQVIDTRYQIGERPSAIGMCSFVRSEVKSENLMRRRLSLPEIIISENDDTLYMQIYRRLKARDQKEVDVARYGDKAAEERFGMANEGIRLERILERVQIDHTKLDLFVVDDQDRLPIGRPTFTFAEDEKSGYPVGFYVGWEPPSYWSVAQCLRHAILPKDYVKETYPSVVHDWDASGLPEQLVVDNGKEFLSRSLEDACFQLGIELVLCPPASPWFKGAIERHFGSINTMLLHTLPGTTFSNVLDKGDYEPGKNAVITLSAFLEILHVFLIDIYAQRQGRNGQIPARIWEEGASAYPLAIPPCREELVVLLGDYQTRTIQKQGIQLEDIFYSSPQLAPLRTKLKKGRGSEPVAFKYDRSDLSTIWVLNPSTKQYLEVPCVPSLRDYTCGLSMWKHRVIKRYAREVLNRVDYEALSQAKATIQAIVDREYSETKRTATRQKLNRFRTSGTNIRKEEDAFPVLVPSPQGLASTGSEAPAPTAGAETLRKPQLDTEDRGQEAVGRKKSTRQKSAKDPVPAGTSSVVSDEDDLDMTGWGSGASVRIS